MRSCERLARARAAVGSFPGDGWPERAGEDFAYVAGWGYVERALEVAAAGVHNVVT